MPNCMEIMKTRSAFEKTMAPMVSQVRRDCRQRFRQAIAIFMIDLSHYFQALRASTGLILGIFIAGINAVIKVTMVIIVGPIIIEAADNFG